MQPPNLHVFLDALLYFIDEVAKYYSSLKIELIKPFRIIRIFHSPVGISSQPTPVLTNGPTSLGMVETVYLDRPLSVSSGRALAQVYPHSHQDLLQLGWCRAHSNMIRQEIAICDRGHFMSSFYFEQFSCHSTFIRLRGGHHLPCDTRQ